jgi:hypothetical protein
VSQRWVIHAWRMRLRTVHMTANGRPPGASTAPAAPLTSAGRADRTGPEKSTARAATAAAQVPRLSWRDLTVDPELDVRVQHLHERVEVSVAQGSEERTDDAVLTGPGPGPGPSGPVGVRGWRAGVPRPGTDR